ncbi:MAG: pilus assembly protein PilM [Verrucomicrobia bacterium]|nr:pilus assembly protein PilM [Verrucomicrobiota bacterium]
MSLPFINRSARKRDQILAIDLGGRTTKAVLMQRKGDTLTLTRYAMLDAPVQQKTFSPDLLAEHLKSIVAALDTKTKNINLIVGCQDTIVRQAEMPQIPIQDMRQILKMSPKTYLQQDLPNHIFDCYIIPPRQLSKPDEKGKLNPAPQKFKVLVAGIKKQLLDDLLAAVHKADLIADGILPGLISPINAFEVAMPDLFAKNVVALVDIGFKNTTICLLQEGELVLSRVIAIGGDKITGGLAEAMGISYAEAEGIKMGMPSEVQPTLEALVSPLGRELRASLDFFEHQQDKHVSQVFISGGSARSEFIVKILETEMTVNCRAWNPASTLPLALPPQQTAEIEQVAPQLTIAVGAALAL